MEAGYLQQHKRSILSAISIIIEQFDCPITLNETSKFCKSWLTSKNSPLYINEKWTLFSKIVDYIDKHPENITQPYYLRFASI